MKYKAYHKTYRESHREEVKAYDKAYREAHHKEAKARERARYAKMKAQGLSFKKGPNGKWGWYPQSRCEAAVPLM